MIGRNHGEYEIHSFEFELTKNHGIISMSTFKKFLYNEKESIKQIVVAVTAMQCEYDPVENRIKMVTTIENIIQFNPTVELVIFGEMILGWYSPGANPDYHREISESILGNSTQTLAILAEKFGIYICFGISELDGGNLYNSQVLLNPQGDIQAIHRKSNLKPGEKVAKYLCGTEKVTTTEIKGIKTGIVVCSDTASPQTMWDLMRSNFELIIHSLADDDRDDFVTTFQAGMYDAWIITANRFGNEGEQFWPGLITITDPLGKVRGRHIGQERFMVYELHFADSGSNLKKIIRNIWVKVPLIFHLIKNWKRIKPYL